MSKFVQLVFVLFFLTTITLPLVIGTFEPDQVISTFEKRSLNSLPLTPETIDELARFPSKYSEYYSDHFGFREAFTGFYFAIKRRINIEFATEDVTVGKDGWMFLGSANPGYQSHEDPIGDAINVNLFTPEELKEFSDSKVRVKTWLASIGVEYLFVVAPNKHTIYFEMLPDHIKKQQDESATDQLIKYMNDNTDIHVLDLRKALFAEKAIHNVYFKYDSHWNHYGANAAQFAIMQSVSSIFPGRYSPQKLSSKSFKTDLWNGGDLALLTGIGNLTEDKPSPIFEGGCETTEESVLLLKEGLETMICESGQLSAVIFGDSFFSALLPYISRQFYRSVYAPEKLSDSKLRELISLESPDIVIDEVVERFFPYVP